MSIPASNYNFVYKQADVMLCILQAVPNQPVISYFSKYMELVFWLPAHITFFRFYRELLIFSFFHHLFHKEYL